eukprot:2768263-Pleurochrysis_carterae.AAC.5
MHDFRCTGRSVTSRTYAPFPKAGVVRVRSFSPQIDVSSWDGVAGLPSGSAQPFYRCVPDMSAPLRRPRRNVLRVLACALLSKALLPLLLGRNSLRLK